MAKIQRQVWRVDWSQQLPLPKKTKTCWKLSAFFKKIVDCSVNLWNHRRLFSQRFREKSTVSLQPFWNVTSTLAGYDDWSSNRKYEKARVGEDVHIHYSELVPIDESFFAYVYSSIQTTLRVRCMISGAKSTLLCKVERTRSFIFRHSW